ncbi:MAG: DUF6134 family protein [Pikeienuella sp.]
MKRRSVLAGFAVAGIGLTGGAGAATEVRRTFKILRNGSDIGRHSLVARTTGEGFEIVIDIEIVVRVLGIAAYRYELSNTEVWAGGRLLRLDSRTNDDGDPFAVSVRGDGTSLAIEGTGHNGLVPSDAVTTSYYVPDFMQRRPWISTQSGKPLAVNAQPQGQGPRRVYQVTGDIKTRLSYDARGEWIGSEFDAGGEPARYEVIEDTGLIAPLWRAA